jgi:ribosome recycling factor
MITKESVVNSLLFKFQRAGYNLFAVNDGQETHRVGSRNTTEARKFAVDHVVGVDESAVTFVRNGRRIGLWIVLSCDPEEIAADYTYPRDLEEEIDKIMDSFFDQWEGKKWSKND